MHVEDLFIAAVEANKDLIGMLPIGDDVAGANALKRRQAAAFSGFGVDGEEVIILVAVGVLEIENGLVVFGPRIGPDAGCAVAGDDAVVVLADGFDPDVQYAFGGREVRQPEAVGAEPRAGAFRVAK